RTEPPVAASPSHKSPRTLALGDGRVGSVIVSNTEDTFLKTGAILIPGRPHIEVTRRGGVMMKALKFSIVALFPFTYPHSAIAWTSLTYEEAAWMCSIGNLQACDVMYAYEMDRSRVPGGGLLTDPWLSPGELQPGGTRGVRHGPLSTNDFSR